MNLSLAAFRDGRLLLGIFSEAKLIIEYIFFPKVEIPIQEISRATDDLANAGILEAGALIVRARALAWQY